MRKIMGKIAAFFTMSVALLFAVGMEVAAAGGSSSLGTSASSVNIGDTVSVTMNVSADVYASFRMSVSYDSSVLEYTGTDKSGDCNGGGGALSVLSEVDGGGTYSITFKFKAIAPGDASVSASAVEALAMETAEAINISGSSAGVTVNNAASDNGGSSDNGSTDNGTATDNPGDGSNGENGGENTGGKTSAPEPQPQPEPQPVLSADNSLKTLTISPGTLSPEFKYNTTKYTASVASDVTRVAVDAQVSNSKASVESVSGNTNLQPGENTIKIVVKAENGTLAVYTILVNRGGATGNEENTDEPDENTEPEEETVVESTGIRIGGVDYEVSASLPETELPEEFTANTVSYNGEEVEGYAFPYADLVLLYLNPIHPEDAEEETQEKQGIFAFYNAAANVFFPYINITVGNTYALVLPKNFSDVIPEGYQEATVSVNGNTVEGCQKIPEGDAADTDFYLLYCVAQSGVAGWYEYDAVDMSLQRFHENVVVMAAEEEESGVDASVVREEYKKLETKYKEAKASSRTIIAVLVFLLVVLVIVLVNVIIFKNSRGGRRKGIGKNEDMDYIDFDDL